jgi:hypothetical protein
MTCPVVGLSFNSHNTEGLDNDGSFHFRFTGRGLLLDMFQKKCTELRTLGPAFGIRWLYSIVTYKVYCISLSHLRSSSDPYAKIPNLVTISPHNLMCITIRDPLYGPVLVCWVVKASMISCF